MFLSIKVYHVSKWHHHFYLYSLGVCLQSSTPYELLALCAISATSPVIFSVWACCTQALACFRAGSEKWEPDAYRAQLIATVPHLGSSLAAMDARSLCLILTLTPCLQVLRPRSQSTQKRCSIKWPLIFEFKRLYWYSLLGKQSKYN
jgi:hypothetical protein